MMSFGFFGRRLLIILFLMHILSISFVVVIGNNHKTDPSAPNNVSYSNASALLAALLTDYDIRLRPGFGGEALLLTMDMIVASFDAMSEVNMDYTVTIYLHQYWRDERLAWLPISSSANTQHHNAINDMTLSGDFSTRIWVPDTFLANDKHSFLHDVTETNKMLRLSRDGRVAYGMRFTSTLACHMDLRNYPLDVQNCTVEIESYGYTTNEVLMKWNEPMPVHGVDQVNVPQFTILSYHTEDSVVETATGAYQRLSLVFQLRRSIGYFIFQTYLPCQLIVSFWINHEATSARVALGITTVLTMTTISTGVRQSLPRISYVKSIDIYLVMCFVFVFSALIEYAIVNYSYWGSRSRRRKPSAMTAIRSKLMNPEGGAYGGGGFGVADDDADEQSNDPDGGGGGTSSMTTTFYGPNWSSGTAVSPIVQTNCTAAEVRFEAVDVDDDDYRNELNRRPTSPLPSLVQRPYNQDDTIEIPEYPRTYASGSNHHQLRFRPSASSSSSINRLRKFGSTARRSVSIRSGLQRFSRKARAVIPRIRDVNVIDKHSRIIFPASFILFNVMYWGYYTMMQ